MPGLVVRARGDVQPMAATTAETTNQADRRLRQALRAVRDSLPVGERFV